MGSSQSNVSNFYFSAIDFYFILFYFISFIGHRNSRLQGERPMGLVQMGKRDPCKAQPLNKSMTTVVIQHFGHKRELKNPLSKIHRTHATVSACVLLLSIVLND